MATERAEEGSGKTEYRQFCPTDLTSDDPSELDRRLEYDVRTNISMMVSRRDDPEEFAADVKISRRQSRDKQGYWIHGEIDMPIHNTFARLNPVVESDWRSAIGKKAADHEPVDLTPEEYAAHLAEKDAR
jgi:hypothetical protein